MPLLLELFKGTGSAGKAFKGDVISVDIESKFNPTINEDLLKLKYKELPIPDYIWASPPCNTFSLMSVTRDKVYNPNIPQRQRNSDTMRPFTPSARLGDKLLKRTIEIINYFKKKNPKLKFVIENPHGTMWKSPILKGLPKYHREMAYYCNYSDTRTKPTDFFSNVKLDLNNSVCKGTELTRKMSMCDKYKIPPKLMREIYKQITKSNALMV